MKTNKKRCLAFWISKKHKIFDKIGEKIGISKKATYEQLYKGNPWNKDKFVPIYNEFFPEIKLDYFNLFEQMTKKEFEKFIS